MAAKTPCCGQFLNDWSKKNLECGHCGLSISQKEIADAIERARIDEESKDSINPSHYKSHPSGIECIQVTEHMGFTLGNAVKYIWRADLKHNDGGIEDLKKAQWYINRELDKRQSQSEKQESSA